MIGTKQATLIQFVRLNNDILNYKLLKIYHTFVENIWFTTILSLCVCATSVKLLLVYISKQKYFLFSLLIYFFFVSLSRPITPNEENSIGIIEQIIKRFDDLSIRILDRKSDATKQLLMRRLSMIARFFGAEVSLSNRRD